MGGGWVDGAERLASYHGSGGTYDPNAPWRFVVHTTEVVPTDLAGAIGMAERHASPPHLWAWPAMNWVGQTVPIDRSAFALAHPTGTPETNRLHAVQVEVIGYAGETPGWPDEWWEWLGQHVLAPAEAELRASLGLDGVINLGRVAATTGGDGYGLGGTVRMTRDEWWGFDGVCGHANVPDNEHWDPGAANLGRMAFAARLALGAPAAAVPAPPVPNTPPTVSGRIEFDMAHLEIVDLVIGPLQDVSGKGGCGYNDIPDTNHLQIVGEPRYNGTATEAPAGPGPAYDRPPGMEIESYDWNGAFRVVVTGGIPGQSVLYCVTRLVE